MRETKVYLLQFSGHFCVNVDLLLGLSFLFLDFFISDFDSLFFDLVLLLFDYSVVDDIPREESLFYFIESEFHSGSYLGESDAELFFDLFLLLVDFSLFELDFCVRDPFGLALGDVSGI